VSRIAYCAGCRVTVDQPITDGGGYQYYECPACRRMFYRIPGEAQPFPGAEWGRWTRAATPLPAMDKRMRLLWGEL